MATLHRCSRTVCKLTSPCLVRCRQKQLPTPSQRNYSNKKQSILGKLLDYSGTYAENLETHKALAALATNNVYDFQFETVKPENMENYIEATSDINTRLHEDEAYPGKLLLSLKSVYGGEELAIHIWNYDGGNKALTDATNYHKNNKELQDFHWRTKQWCNLRTNQLCHKFSYFSGDVPQSAQDHIYELRTYALKPGSLLEWGKYWSFAHNIPREDTVAAFYSQVGDLYMVQHLWVYHDMQHRCHVRDNMWQIPGWDDCVAATLPLVRHMKNRILVPI